MSEWRFIAQRATTKQFLDFDIPLTKDELSWDLGGPGSLKGSVSPDVGTMRAEDGELLLQEWGTLLYAEANGQIRWGGIVVSSSFDAGTWKVEAAGFGTYPHGLAYAGAYSKIGIDPVDAVKEIWRHVQSYPDGNLQVAVTGSKTPVRIGTPPRDVSFTTAAGQDVAFVSGPYELNWWSAPDCGSEIESLAKQTPFDFVEKHYWSGDTIKHEFVIGYPRHGKRRTDLSFIQGDNIAKVVTPQIDGDDYANEVMGLGAGEGKGGLHRTTAVRDGRLRRSYVYSDKSVTAVARMDSLIKDQLQRRHISLDIQQVTVMDHPNARIGSWDLGDDILIQANLPWLGEIELWCRIVGWSLLSENTATLALKRSDAFTYGG